MARILIGDGLDARELLFNDPHGGLLPSGNGRPDFRPAGTTLRGGGRVRKDVSAQGL